MTAPSPRRAGPAPTRIFNTGALVFAGLALASGVAAWLLEGDEAVARAVRQSGELLLAVLPQLAAGLLVGGLVRELVPQDKVARYLGGRSGLRGLAVASLLGMFTPGGPFTSFPLVYALYVAGADIGALVAYVGAWSLISLHRLLIWELPFLEFDLAILRFVACLPLPVLGGLIARYLARLPALDPDRERGGEGRP